MATVYLAEDLKHHRQVAIKVLRSPLAEAIGEDRFMREVEIAARLNHPYILALHDSGVLAGVLYYVMPFVDGESLRSRLAREGALPIGETCRILRDVADALAYAHRHGVVHRDVKPENILLSEGHAFVADFGVAKPLGDMGGATGTRHGALTSAGVTVGTPAYMAPEQAAADPNVTSRADLYALGVVAYEMLTGRPPFTGATAQQVLAAQVTESPDPVTKRRSSIPEPLALLVMQCLEKNPADRPRNAEALLPTLDGMTAAESRAFTAPLQPSLHAQSNASGAVRRLWWLIPVIVALAAIAAGGYHYWRGATARNSDDGSSHVIAPSTNAKSIAVLPFDNLSADTTNAYFAAGIQDEILTRLADIRQMKVIARTSAVQYASHPQDVAQVGRELGVATVLEGTVQRAEDQMRVNVQLVDASSGAHVWAHSYDGDVKHIFAVETEIAQHVADALKAQLLPAEEARVASVPTRNAAAYDSFMEAEYLVDQAFATGAGQPAALLARGEKLYEQAIALDPDFALAYAQLAYADAYSYWTGIDRSEARLAKATDAAHHALTLQPQLPEAHLSMGYLYYWGHRDYPAALGEFETARQNAPNNAHVISAIAYVQRREGDIPAAIAGLRRVEVLDPRNPSWPMELGATFAPARQYDSAVAALDQSIAIQPTFYQAVIQKAWVLTLAGKPVGARAVLATIPSGIDPRGEVSLVAFEIARVTRQPKLALSMISHAPAVIWRPQATASTPVSLLLGQAFATTGDSVHSRVAYEEASRTLEAQVRTEPGDPNALSSLGLAYAGLGKASDAVSAGRHATELLPMSRDAIDGSVVAVRLAAIYARVGDANDAVQLLRQLLAMPSGSIVSLQLLRIDPTWDPLRSDSSFKALLAAPSQSQNSAY